MKYFDGLKDMDQNGIRAFVKENEANPDFIDEILAYKEGFVPLLSRAKAMRDSFICSFSSLSDLDFVINCLVQEGFTPGVNALNHLVSFGPAAESAVKCLLASFPSIPVGVPLLISMINNGLIGGAAVAFNTRKELQTPKVATLFIEFCDGEHMEAIQGLIIATEENRERIIRAINENKGKFANAIVDRLILEYNASICYNAFKRYTVSKASYEKIIEALMIKQRGYYGASKLSDSIKWSQELEELPAEYTHIILVSNPPKSSRYRKGWLQRHPEDADNQELLALFNSDEQSVYESYSSRSSQTLILEESLKRADLVLDLDPARIEKRTWPKRFAGLVNNHPNEIKYQLYMKMSSTFKRALRSSISDDFFKSKSNSSSKKSYFPECIKAVVNNNIDELRTITSGSYTLEKFCEDSHQISKKASVAKVSLSKEFYKLLNKEEFLAFLKSAFRFKLPYNGTLSDLKITLSYEETLLAAAKINYNHAFCLCSEKKKFLELHDLSEIRCAMGDDFIKACESDPVLKEAFTNKVLTYSETMKGNYGFGHSFSGDDIFRFASIYPSHVLRKFPMLLRFGSGSKLINLKCTDGEFLFSDEEVLTNLFTTTGEVENSGNLETLRKRDPQLLKKLTDAYITSDEALQSLIPGIRINKRWNPQIVSLFNRDVTLDKEKIIDEVFSRGGHWNDFTNASISWFDDLCKYHKGRPVRVGRFEVSWQGLNPTQHEAFLLSSPTARIRATDVVIHDNYKVLKNVVQQIEFLDICTSLYMNTAYFADIKRDILDQIDCSTKRFLGENIQHLALIKLGCRFANTDDFLNRIIHNFYDHYTPSMMVPELKILENHGLVYNENTVSAILQFNRSEEVVDYLASRLGGLNGRVVNSESFRDIDAKLVSLLRDYGCKALPKGEFEIYQAKKNIQDAGKDFEPVNIGIFPRNVKVEIINFIEKEIDPRFKSLNILATNLDELDTIYPYEEMKQSFGLEDSEIAKIFNIPKNLLNNRKLMTGLKNLMSIDVGVIQKITLFRNTVKCMGDIEISMDDLIQYGQNHDNIQESDSIRGIKSAALREVLKESDFIAKQSHFLKGMDKTAIMRFLRSADDINSLRDIFSMARQILNGVDALYDRAEAMQSVGDNPTMVEDLKKTAESVTRRFREVCSMDNVTHMHDRLVPICGFIKADPLQPLGQDKYSKLEKSKEVAEEAGVKLFFPKVRGDLQVIGEMHGWCVASHKSYGDNLLSKGNILVALVPKDKETAPENIIALAHFLHDGRGNYSIEQLKWSRKVQNGRNNVDAINDFDHHTILRLIMDHIEYLKEKEKKEQEAFSKKQKGNEEVA